MRDASFPVVVRARHEGPRPIQRSPGAGDGAARPLSADRSACTLVRVLAPLLLRVRGDHGPGRVLASTGSGQRFVTAASKSAPRSTGTASGPTAAATEST